jgi:tetratricopeptide (TPR) repeat protein
MKRLLISVLVMVVTAGVAIAETPDDFSRAVIYYLLNDLPQSTRYFDAYFRVNPQPTIRAGFTLLLDDQKWEATKKFKDYLDSDHRSLTALIGISLAISDIKNSNVFESLQRPLRLDPRYGPAYLCLGFEYLKRRDFPAAEKNFTEAIKNDSVAEFKIPLADLYLQLDQPQKALDLIKPEADQVPENFYFNMLTARALFKLNQTNLTPLYLDQALAANPESREAGLLKARSLLARGEFRKAKSTLADVKSKTYDPEYSLTFAEALLRMKDRDAEKYLYEVFSQNRWLPSVNRLLGIYHLQRGERTVQTWIDRALMSGDRREDLQKDFPASFRFGEIPSLPFFDIRKIHWLDSNTLLLAGRLLSGEAESLLVLDLTTFKVLKSFSYQGTIQELYASPRGDKLVFSTTASADEKVYVYAFLWQSGKSPVLRPAIGYALNIPGIIAGFAPSGDTVYFTSKRLDEMAFDSPFAVVSAYGKQTPIYPRYPLPVFRYQFAADSFAEIRDPSALRAVPIPSIQKYLLVADACQRNDDINALIEKGRKLAITSSDMVRIVFDPARTTFIIYYADLKNAFQALVYDKERNRCLRIDETMFLGKNRFAEGDVFRFDPSHNEIFFLTRDKEKALYVFNYRSLLFRKVADKIMEVAYNENTRSLLLLSERTRHLFYTETNAEIVHLEPFSRIRLGGRRDFDKIIGFDDFGRASFSTFNGELVRVDENESCKSLGVSPAGSPYCESPNRSRLAVFVNGRLFVLPGIG